MEDTQVEPRTKVLKNGAVYDLDKKRIVANPGGGTTAITSETASEFHARRRELKQQRIIAGAAKVLESSGDWETPNDLDVVEAIGEAVMVNAMDPDSKKQIDAAKFILTEAGLSEANSRRENTPAQPGSISGSPDALMQLVGMIEAERAAAVERARAVDVNSTDIRNGETT
jgi:hypothetical protein